MTTTRNGPSIECTGWLSPHGNNGNGGAMDVPGRKTRSNTNGVGRRLIQNDNHQAPQTYLDVEHSDDEAEAVFRLIKIVS